MTRAMPLPARRVAPGRTTPTPRLPWVPLLVGGLGAALLPLGNGGVGLGLVVLAVAAAVGTALGPRERGRVRLDDVVTPSVESPDDRMARVEQQRLQAALSDPAQVGAVVRPRLVAAVTARLARRGTTLTDPAARDLLGGPLWTFVTDPTPRHLTARELDDLLTRVEAL